MPVNTKKCTVASVGAAAGEFVGMYLFVLTGAASAMVGSGNLQVALTFGLAITALAYSLGHHSGGQFNCAVTWGLVLAGKLGAVQGILNFIAQLVGAILAGFTAKLIIPQANDRTYGTDGPGVACNALKADVTASSAFFGEVLFTCLLVLVVLETATSKRTGHQRGYAALAIGLAVFLGHSVLIPLDGCSINPTRTFGTAVAAAASQTETGNSPWDHSWIFWLGPLVGASLAAPIYHLLRMFQPVDSAWLVDPPKPAPKPAPVPRPEPEPVVEPFLPPLMPQQFIPSYSMQLAAPTTAYAMPTTAYAAVPQVMPTTAYAAVPQTTSYAAPMTTGYASPAYASPGYASPGYGGAVV